MAGNVLFKKINGEWVPQKRLYSRNNINLDERLGDAAKILEFLNDVSRCIYSYIYESNGAGKTGGAERIRKEADNFYCKDSRTWEQIFIWQGNYILKNGVVSDYAGVDFSKLQILNSNKLLDMHPHAIRLLKNSGLVFTGDRGYFMPCQCGKADCKAKIKEVLDNAEW